MVASEASAGYNVHSKSLFGTVFPSMVTENVSFSPPRTVFAPEITTSPFAGGVGSGGAGGRSLPVVISDGVVTASAVLLHCGTSSTASTSISTNAAFFMLCFMVLSSYQFPKKGFRILHCSAERNPASSKFRLWVKNLQVTALQRRKSQSPRQWTDSANPPYCCLECAQAAPDG